LLHTPAIRPRSALNRLRARNLVGPATVIRLAHGAVNVDLNAGVVGLVGAGEANRLPGSKVAARLDVDLGARDVELRLALVGGRVESEQLDAHEVVTGSDALREVEVDPAVVVDHGVDGPLPGGGVEAVVPDLEPG